jgi:TATA-binding protein-associated factor Taf7
LFPHVPIDLIQQDLRMTQSVELTAENILEDRLNNQNRAAANLLNYTDDDEDDEDDDDDETSSSDDDNNNNTNNSNVNNRTLANMNANISNVRRRRNILS